jgi:hypothetical protein
MLVYVHPIGAGIVIVLAFWMLQMGLVQRDQRTKKKPAPPGNLKRHSALGPWIVGGYLAAAVVGLVTTVTLRDWKPLASWHGRFALLAGAGFVYVWLNGRKLLAGEKQRANRHGVIAVIAAFIAAIAGLLGISMLP